MACCNSCFADILAERIGGQGHYLCGNPSQGRIIAYKHGYRPTLRSENGLQWWSMAEAFIAPIIDDNGEPIGKDGWFGMAAEFLEEIPFVEDGEIKSKKDSPQSKGPCPIFA